MISVVTVVKDDLHGFVRTRQSIEAQTFRAWEHIIVPASEGDSVALFASQLLQDRTRVWIQEGSGIYSAMNQGLEQSAGEYVVFLNAGDVLAGEEAFEVVNRERIKDAPDWMVFGGFIVRNQRTRQIHPVPHPDSQLVGFGRANIMHPSVYYRRTFLVGLGGYDESFSIAGDLELNLRAIARKPPLVVDSPTAVFFADGVSSTRVFTSISEAFRARSMGLDAGSLAWVVSLAWYLNQLVRAVFAKGINRLNGANRT